MEELEFEQSFRNMIVVDNLPMLLLPIRIFVLLLLLRNSDDEDLRMEEELEFEQSFRNTIVVDNLPMVPTEKFEKLEGIVRKIFNQVGPIKEDGVWMPFDPDTQITLGICFIEYNTPLEAEAEMSRDKTNGYKLSRARTLAVCLFDDIDKFLNVPEVRVPPETKPYIPGENLQKWLMDEKARDQFVIHAGSDTEVLWNDARQSRPEIVCRIHYTESLVQWSPLGIFLATGHELGVTVWGGATTFNHLMQYPHSQVKVIDFSPNENFLVTYSSRKPSNPCDSFGVGIKKFDVRTGKVSSEIREGVDELTGGVSGVSWPVYRWGGGKDASILPD